MLSHVTDLELLENVAAGDDAAFAALFDRHAPRLLHALRRWLGEDAAAEDVLQETFLQVWRGAARYDPERSPPGAWLFLLARSRAHDHQRRHAPRPPTNNARSDPNDPLSDLVSREDAGRLGLALDRLPREQREAIVLAFYGGLTHEQVATRLDLPLGTAKTRIRLGIRRLRDLLQSVGE